MGQTCKWTTSLLPTFRCWEFSRTVIPLSKELGKVCPEGKGNGIEEYIAVFAAGWDSISTFTACMHGLLLQAL